MESLIAIGIGLCIGFSPIGSSKLIRIIVTAVTGGWRRKLQTLNSLDSNTDYYFIF